LSEGRASRALVLWLVAICLLTGGHANAEDRDRVTVKFFPAPVPLGASEPMDVQFERRQYTTPSDQRPDRFFDQIDQILSTHGISSDWRFILPDGAFIRITVEIGGRRLELSSAHTIYERDGRLVATERGLVALDGRDPKQVLARESAAFRSRRLAFEKILALVTARVRETLGP
jgi:hypothetical protein